MTSEQWEIMKRAAKCEKLDNIPVGMIVDSPWMPGYCGVNTLDFYTDFRVWTNCYKKIKEDFPEMIYVPDYWVEFGMASESVAFGCRPKFYSNQPVCIDHLIDDVDDIDNLNLTDPDPNFDGLMPLALNYYRKVNEMTKNTDDKPYMIASRGPLNIASFIMSVPEFCLALKIYPDETKEILEKTTKLIIKWLNAQKECLDNVEGILILDDICGFISEEDYLEFAHPYLKKIFDSFDVPVKMFHNDNFGNGYITFPHIKDLGINIFNFSYSADIVKAREMLGDDVCIFGNIPARDVLTMGSTEDVKREVNKILDAYGSKSGIIFSAGGGASPGMPKDNCRAMIEAVNEWNLKH